MGTERISLEPSGNFESVEDLGRTVISLPGRRELLYLGDIAHIARGYIDPPSAKMFTNGAPSLGLAVSLRDGGDISRLGMEVDVLLSRLRTAYPIGVDFDPEELLAKFQNLSAASDLLQRQLLNHRLRLLRHAIRMYPGTALSTRFKQQAYITDLQRRVDRLGQIPDGQQCYRQAGKRFHLHTRFLRDLGHAKQFH